MSAPYGLRYRPTAADLLRDMDADSMHDCMGDFSPDAKTRGEILQALLDGDDGAIGMIVRQHCEDWADTYLREVNK